jgi:hypothetical protein
VNEQQQIECAGRVDVARDHLLGGAGQSHQRLS